MTRITQGPVMTAGYSKANSLDASSLDNQPMALNAHNTKDQKRIADALSNGQQVVSQMKNFLLRSPSVRMNHQDRVDAVRMLNTPEAHNMLSSLILQAGQEASEGQTQTGGGDLVSSLVNSNSVLSALMVKLMDIALTQNQANSQLQGAFGTMAFAASEQEASETIKAGQATFAGAVSGGVLNMGATLGGSAMTLKGHSISADSLKNNEAGRIGIESSLRKTAPEFASGKNIEERGEELQSLKLNRQQGSGEELDNRNEPVSESGARPDTLAAGEDAAMRGANERVRTADGDVNDGDAGNAGDSGADSANQPDAANKDDAKLKAGNEHLAKDHSGAIEKSQEDLKHEAELKGLTHKQQSVVADRHVTIGRTIGDIGRPIGDSVNAAGNMQASSDNAQAKLDDAGSKVEGSVSNDAADARRQAQQMADKMLQVIVQMMMANTDAMGFGAQKI
ncbi:IpaC/SipC family type III secretion system effector [Paludibacterium paludis]|uniref:Effector protein BipC n=1 Tax=Paludibacterium paludis TaxID=1225769 RepID=A0A918P5L8_9NEIS|nr:IpaC/SipC family type III secretion system effector [Paludibacterium paludis]GGY23931.1 hypothetical protein GCM10011289_29560 [Paludibacterium paludis]